MTKVNKVMNSRGPANNADSELNREVRKLSKFFFYN
jgi:hypothetical protein